MLKFELSLQFYAKHNKLKLSNFVKIMITFLCFMNVSQYITFHFFSLIEISFMNQ
jgi:hypothetical protein